VPDGLEAVQQAQDFRPELILLDIGLPTLNGIKAAQRIRDVSPDSKILFLTEESSPDVAEAGFGGRRRWVRRQVRCGKRIVGGSESGQ